MIKYNKILDFGFAIDNSLYDTEQNVKTMNLMLISVLLIFSIVNYFFKDLANIASLEFLIASSLVVSTLVFYKYKNLMLYIFSTTLILFISVLFVHFFVELTYFSSLFIIFFPVVAFMINGLRIGAFATILFDLIILTDVYLKDLNGFEHLVVALISLSILAYYFEYSRRNIFSKLQNAVTKLEEKSQLDELTLLPNRHFLNEEILNNEKLYGKPVLFCISDIDNFKAYNDFYGHPMGDKVIKNIAEIKEQTVGSSKNNYVVRLGGEEFGGYIFDMNKPKKYIDSFMNTINEAMLKHEKNDPYNICTVSIGAVYCENFTIENYSKMYSIADEALYQAKHSGKNRVVYKEAA